MPTASATAPTTAVAIKQDAAPASAATMRACRDLATDGDVMKVRRLISMHVHDVPVWVLSGAFLAITGLRNASDDPKVDPDVTRAFVSAAEEADRQRNTWLASDTFDPEAFTAMIGTINTACGTAGVDMTVTVF